MSKRPLAAVAILGLLLGAAAAAAQPAGDRVEPRLRQALETASQEWVRVGVTLRRDDLPAPGAAQRARVAERQGRVLGALPAGSFRLGRRYQSLPGMAGWARRAAVEALERHPEVRSVYLDGVVKPTLAQGTALIGADQVHAFGLTGAGLNVAVIDSGVDTDHPDLVDDLVAQQCFCDNHPSPVRGCCPDGDDDQSGPGAAEDTDGHGTYVSGIISSGGVVAPVGVAPGAGIVAMRVFGPNGASFSDIAAALDWVLINRNAFADPIRIVNMSLGDGIERNNPSQTPCSNSNTAIAIDALHAVGIAVFVSSGNEGFDDGISFPACSPNAISVGGVYDTSLPSVSWGGPGACTDTNVSPDDFVCHTNSDEILDLLAPDFATTTSGLGGGVRHSFGGTSASAPYAAAQAALLLEADPSLTPNQIRTALASSGPSVSHPTSGLSWPRSDVGEAVGALVSVCGNGALEPGEDCDDGGTQGGDCCAADCSFEPSGSSCDDGSACTSPDSCDGSGACQPGAPLICDDANLCTDDSCSPASGCVFTNNSASCDDADLCTDGDVCSGGACQPGPPLDCDDGDPCTAESCDAISGCASEPIPNCGSPVPVLPHAGGSLLGVLLAASGAWLLRSRARHSG